jgi:hypothetical protein
MLDAASTASKFSLASRRQQHADLQPQPRWDRIKRNAHQRIDGRKPSDRHHEHQHQRLHVRRSLIRVKREGVTTKQQRKHDNRSTRPERFAADQQRKLPCQSAIRPAQNHRGTRFASVNDRRLIHASAVEHAPPQANATDAPALAGARAVVLACSSIHWAWVARAEQRAPLLAPEQTHSVYRVTWRSPSDATVGAAHRFATQCAGDRLSVPYSTRARASPHSASLRSGRFLRFGSQTRLAPSRLARACLFVVSSVGQLPARSVAVSLVPDVPEWCSGASRGARCSAAAW